MNHIPIFLHLLTRGKNSRRVHSSPVANMDSTEGDFPIVHYAPTDACVLLHDYAATTVVKVVPQEDICLIHELPKEATMEILSFLGSSPLNLVVSWKVAAAGDVVGDVTLAPSSSPSAPAKRLKFKQQVQPDSEEAMYAMSCIDIFGVHSW